jgi:uncharacterized protein YpuA (DUF1002 family)
MVAARLFHNMATRPCFLLLVPAVYVVLIVVAHYSNENYAESSTRNIWTTTDDYAENQEYLKSLGKDEATVSIFSAIAIARDDGNLLTESRLDEITARMKATEATTVRMCPRACYYL